MTLLQKLLTTAATLILLVILGCSLVQNSIVPCYIDEDAAAYADAPLTQLMPWTTIQDAERIYARMEYVHQIKQLGYHFLRNSLSAHLADAEQFKQVAFSPSGLLGLLLPAGMGAILGGYMISKPDDKKKITELQNGNSKNS